MLGEEARGILGMLKRHGVKTQLWVTGGGKPVASEDLRRQRVEAEADRIRPIAEAAAAIGCQVGLYNNYCTYTSP